MAVRVFVGDQSERGPYVRLELRSCLLRDTDAQPVSNSCGGS